MSESNERPAWTHEMSENDARWLARGGITRITHHSQMTGVDTSRDWIELHRDNEKMSVSSNFLNQNGFFAFNPNWRELVTPTWRGEQAINDIRAIDKWEETNKTDRAEYERLKRKFGKT